MLLDELGAATDPEEGGALGVAIVEHFRAAGAFTLVSTHLTALKIYGAATEGVSTARWASTSRPSSRPTIASGCREVRGPEIATRLGMPEDIMNRARRSMWDRERDVTRFLSELHRRIEESATLEEELRRKIADYERREKELAREWEKRESVKLKELERRTDEALARFEDQAQEAIGKIAQSADRRKADQEAQRRVAKTKRELREDFQTTVLSTQDDSRQGRIQPLRHRRGRARPPARRARAGARAAQARQRPHRSRGRLHEDAGLGGRRNRSPAGRPRPIASCRKTCPTSRRPSSRRCTRRST